MLEWMGSNSRFEEVRVCLSDKGVLARRETRRKSRRDDSVREWNPEYDHDDTQVVVLMES